MVFLKQYVPWKLGLGHQNLNKSLNHPNITIKLQAMQDAPPLQLYPASDKFLMWNQRKAAKYL